MITMKRFIGFSLVTLTYLSYQHDLVSASIEPVERIDRFTSFNGDRFPTNDPYSRRGQTIAAHSVPVPVAAIVGTEDQVKDAFDKVGAAENSLASRLPQLQSGETMKRWIALATTQVNLENREDLNQQHALNELLQNPVGAADDVRSLLESGRLLEEERLAVIRLSNDLTNNELSLPLVERVLSDEIVRRLDSGEQAESPEALGRRLSLVTESFFRHVHDSEKRIEFLAAAKAAHPGSNAVSVLENQYRGLLEQTPNPSAINADANQQQNQWPNQDPGVQQPEQAQQNQWPPVQPEQPEQNTFQPIQEERAGYDGGYDPPVETSNFF